MMSECIYVGVSVICMGQRQGVLVIGMFVNSAVIAFHTIHLGMAGSPPFSANHEMLYVICVNVY